MNVILLDNVENLGGIGDLVSVKAGYGRNYLLPQGKAALATKQNIAEFEAIVTVLPTMPVPTNTPVPPTATATPDRGRFAPHPTATPCGAQGCEPVPTPTRIPRRGRR